MDASFLGKVGALLGNVIRALTKRRFVSDSFGHKGAWPPGIDPGANITSPAGRLLAPRGSTPSRATRTPGRPFVPFVCRDAYCCNRFDLAANGK